MGGDESAFTAGDWVSVLLAGAAFVVSIASLYYAALRRASLELDVISQTLSPGGFEAPGMPMNDWTPIGIYLANSGAAGTFLEDLDVTDFRYHGDGSPLWSGIDQDRPPASSGIGKGTVFERGDAQSGALHAYLTRPEDVTTAEEVARRAAKLRKVEVTVRWSFRRAKLLRVGQRETKRRHFRVFIDGAPYRDRCVAEWRKTEETQHLADIAEGKDRPPQPNT
jgi:hypothetical protein